MQEPDDTVNTLRTRQQAWAVLCRARFPLYAYFAFCVLFVFFSCNAVAANHAIKSAHVGLTPESTRITLESNHPLDYELSMLSNPHRVVLDINNVQVTPVLASLSQQINAIDPFVERIRVGQFKPHVTRLVFDLKANVVPRTFVIAPKENYSYRLVLDVQLPSKPAPTAPKIPPGMAIDDDFVADSLEQLVASISPTLQQPAVIPQPALASLPLPAQKPQRQQTGKNDTTATAVASIAPGPSLKNSRVPRILVVAIDAGHGGHDPGAIGSQGTYEKDVTLAIAKKLKARIDKEPNMRAVLTRTGDYYVTLPQRRLNARKANADLFISIHADANPRPHAHGSSVFTLSEHGATSTTASWLANKENSVDDLMSGVNITAQSKEIKEVLLDLSLSVTINDSVKLAEYVLKQLGNINHLHKRNVEQAGFAVLKSPDIPSILVETAFLSNPKEETKLRQTGYQDKMADALFIGIKKYFADNPALARASVNHVK